MIIRCLLCLTALFAITAAAQQTSTPEALARAKYVYVGIMSPKGEIDFGDSLTTHPDDRQARNEVEDEFRKWKRYTVTSLPEQAELIVLVRKGRRSSVYIQGGPPLSTRGTVTIGKTRETPPPRPTGGSTIGTEAGPDTDLFDVYRAQGGQTGMRLWRGSLRDGLDGPSIPLFQKYKSEVEKAAKRLGL